MTPSACVLTLSILMLGTSVALAQEPADQFEAAIRTTADRLRRDAGAPFSVQADSQLLIRALTVPQDQLLARAEENRIDKQLGAESETAGSTSLVAKGGIPRILALAVENGALTQSQSGTTVTLRGTPVGIISALADKGYLGTYNERDPAIRILQKFSFGLSFDTSRGSVDGQQPQFTGNKKQLSSLTGRISIIDQRDPRRAQFFPQWANLASGAGGAVASASGAFVKAAVEDPAFDAWLTAATAAITAAPRDDLEEVIREQVRLLRTAGLSATTLGTVANARQAYDRLLAERRKILAEVARGAQLVVDYTNERSASGLDTSNVRLVGSVGATVDLTGNVSATFFHGSLPTGVTRRTRDVRAGVQLDVPLGRAESVGRYVVTFAYKLERILDDVPGSDGVVVPGSIGTMSVGQLKLTIPVKDSAIRLPLSITFANRTELVKERVVRGNVGFTYDLDAVFARFKP